MGHPKKRSGRLYLFLFFLSILIVLFFQSSISKIQKIEVLGTERIASEEVLSLSGIHIGDQFLMVSAKKIKEKISKHPEIKEVQIQLKFPGKVKITVKENRIVAYLLKEGKTFVPLLENGHISNEKELDTLNSPIITEWPKTETLPGFCKELAKLRPEILREISEIRLIPNENDPYKLQVYMRNGFEVRTSSVNFADQMKYYPSVISNLDINKPGVIHLNDAGIFYISYEEIANSDEENSAEEPKEDEDQSP
jgi:cell division protein FtsQ